MATMKGNTSLSLLTLALAAAPAFAQDQALAARASQHLAAERASLGLDARHDFRLAKSHQDELGQVHHRYQQTFNGVRVFEGDIIVHQDAEGGFRPHTNALKTGINLNTTPTLSESEAFAVAHQALAPKGGYAVKPTAELVIFPITKTLDRVNRQTGEVTERTTTSYVLAYLVRTELESQADNFKQMNYVVDAHTGAILKSWNNLHTSAASGTGKSQYSGTVTIATNSTSSGFEMRDMTRGTSGTFGNNVVTNANHASTTSTATGSIYTNTTNTWGDGANYVEGSSTTAANGQTAAVDAMFGMMTSWDFYKNVLGRNGIDGTGKATYSRVHIGNSYDNAFWSDSCFCMTYGDGSSFTTLTAMDVAGHEMSHGVIANTVPGGLTYSGESGGLNESNSDIMGTMIEYYDLGGGEASASTTVPSTGGNFTIGEQLSSTPLRYMYKPSLDGSSPDAYSSSVGGLDVHYSSGPGNRQFYFLAQGSSSSSSSNFYSSYLPGGMTGVGNDHATRIHYRATTTYYTSGETYAQARAAHISAAKDLYGAGSAEEIAVWNSFAAINVGSAWSGSTSSAPSITSQPASVTVAAGSTATFSVTASGTAPLSYQWRKNGTNISGATSASYTTPATTSADNGALFSVVVSNSLGSVTSNNATLTVSTTGGGSEAVTNGGFESGATGWSGTTGAINTWSGQPAHGGTKDAWLQGNGSTSSENLSQSITIPSTATSATLTFWIHIDTAETTTTTVYDTLKVQVINGTTTTTLATYSNLNKATGYVQKSFDLSAYKGKTVTLKFLGSEDSSLQTSFVLDDVSVKVQ